MSSGPTQRPAGLFLTAGLAGLDRGPERGGRGKFWGHLGASSSGASQLHSDHAKGVLAGMRVIHPHDILMGPCVTLEPGKSFNERL